MPRTLRIAAVQPALRWLQPMPNMHLLRQTLERFASRQTVDIVVLPEAFNGQPAEHDDGAAAEQTRQFLRTLARTCHVNVIGGSIEYRHEDGRIRNTCFVVDREGREIGQYAKRKLFARETDTRTPGDQAGVFEIAGFRVGVLICADLWFCELARELAGRVDVLCVPAKTTVPSDRYIEYARVLWLNLALTRAVENALPVVVSDWAQARHEGELVVTDRRMQQVHYTAGASSIVDPARRPDVDKIQQALPAGRAGVIVSQIDLDAVAKFRAYRANVGLLPT